MYARRPAPAIVAAVLYFLTVAVTGVGLSSSVAFAAPSRQSDQGGSAADGPPVAVPAAGTFYPAAPYRVLGSDVGYAMAPGSLVTVHPLGHGGLPSSGVSAVMVNVTLTAGTADGALTLAPSGTRPVAPLVTAPTGTTRSVLLTVPVSAAGTFDVSAGAAAASVAADVVGFYAADDTVVAGLGASGGYQPVSPTRIFDTDARQPLSAAERTALSVDLGPAADTHTTALLVRITAKAATAPGALVLSGALPAASPPSSAVSFAPGATVSNLALVPTGVGPGRAEVIVANLSSGATGVALDLVGFYDDGGLGPNLRYRPLRQTTVLDTRSGSGTGLLQPGRPAEVPIDEQVVGDSTFGLVGVVSAVPAQPTDLMVDGAVSGIATLVPLTTGPVSAAVQPEVGANRLLGLQAQGSGTPLDARLDVTGSFEAYPRVTNPASRGWVPAVPGWQISAAPHLPAR